MRVLILILVILAVTELIWSLVNALYIGIKYLYRKHKGRVNEWYVDHMVELYNELARQLIVVETFLLLAITFVGIILDIIERF